MTDPDTSARTCPLGDDCDLTVAWMAGQEEARESFRARINQLEVQLGLARTDADAQRARAEAAEAEKRAAYVAGTNSGYAAGLDAAADLVVQKYIALGHYGLRDAIRALKPESKE